MKRRSGLLLAAGVVVTVLACAVLLGLFTRCFSIAVVIEMLVIIFKVELHHGLKGGYELPLALATMAFVLIFFGAGPISFDAIRGGGRGTRSKGK